MRSDNECRAQIGRHVVHAGRTYRITAYMREPSFFLTSVGPTEHKFSCGVNSKIADTSIWQSDVETVKTMAASLLERLEHLTKEFEALKAERPNLDPFGTRHPSWKK